MDRIEYRIEYRN